jgi:hypothetical protein
MRVVSIDVGLRNFGYAIINNGILIDFDSICIWDLVPKKKRTDYPYIARVLVDNTNIFKGADVVLIERQMQSRMKMIACALRCFFWEKSKMIAPLSVRKYFKISTGVYKENKKASKIFVTRFLDHPQTEKYMSSKKKDDMADAIIQGMYYVQTR